MNYVASITDFFKSPKWPMNLLFSGICMLIPIIGPIVLVGWHVTGFWARKEEDMETFPEFDFNDFVKYLERGLWPFLVSLVVGAVVGFVLWIAMLVPMVVLSALAGGQHGHMDGFIGGVVTLLMMFFYGVVIVVVIGVTTPLMLRAIVTQDFAKAFDFTFVKRFIGLTWLEILLSALFLAVAGAVLSGAGFLVLCVGMYFALGLVYFAWSHLVWQLYKLYVSRGGEPVPLSPKLGGEPPTLIG